MGLKAIQAESRLGYLICGKRYKRDSNRLIKKWRNRKQRRKIKSDVNYTPEYNKYSDYEF